ncbi:threonine kinase [Tistlia consotensis]|uniref:Threonine kinase n=1 Tax=Tistlia consotensis USBA 355 TaxID=560819 RepID=A0A1Y6BTF9_9PROT|nr:hypothetical protein [Tistlia consotensis]SMF28012.1 threonine kinase [Tistlia consotensis USBA 355]SNR65276.1 threonine kinase [Tistlia consotensis]
MQFRGSEASHQRLLEVGVGTAIAHHGELLQGVFEDEQGSLHRGLVTLPLPRLRARATFWPRSGGAVAVRPAGRSKAQRAAELTLAHLGYAGSGGDLTIESDIPLGHGYGSSTADLVASIRAVAAAAGLRLRHSTTCRLAVAAEGASDAIAYGCQALLFAQREGRILEPLGAELPPLIVVSLVSGGEGPVDTVALTPARYDSAEIELFRALRGLVRHALQRQDARLLGRVATVSARVSQRHFPKPRFERALRLAEEHAACGLQVAHSGSLMGVLIDAGNGDATARAATLVREAQRVGFRKTSAFPLGVEEVRPL